MVAENSDRGLVLRKFKNMNNVRVAHDNCYCTDSPVAGTLKLANGPLIEYRLAE